MSTVVVTVVVMSLRTLHKQGSLLALERRHTNTTTKTLVAYGNSLPLSVYQIETVHHEHSA